jgi:DNA-binding NtrC family response regulator
MNTRAPAPASAAAAAPHVASRARVLYTDDEEDLREVFAAVFGEWFDVSVADSGASALTELAKGAFDVLVSDMRMEPMRGSELLRRACDLYPDVPRILLTAFTDHDDLADAVNQGHVFAYVQKPWDTDQLRISIQRAAESRQLALDNKRLVEELRHANVRLEGDVEAVSRAALRPKLQITSPAMARVLEQVTAVAGTDASVLLFGETGVGKELVASAVHDQAPNRRNGRFVAQNLAALPPELMASELFGHVKGAFTGAQAARRGLFELADGGTLFLDEIGEAPLPLQAMLLRALESREIWPVGGSEPRKIDLRIVSATNRDLFAEAQAGRFRLDLYYRLAVAPIEIPPLRSRPEDVRGLGEPMLVAAARRMNRALPMMTEAAWRALERHAWPGNVRELGNVMERLVIYNSGRDVDAGDLLLPSVTQPSTPPAATISDMPPSSRTYGTNTPSFGIPFATSVMTPSSSFTPVGDLSDRTPRPQPTGPASGPSTEEGLSGTLSLALPEGGTTFEEIEREILAQVLSRADGNQSRAARSLGLSESTLRSRLKRLGLKG